MEFFGLASGGETGAIIEALVVRQGRIAVRDIESARWLAYTRAKPTGIGLTKWPKLAAFSERIVGREAVRAAMRAVA